MNTGQLRYPKAGMSREHIIEISVNNIIVALGDDPSREGLLETPKRVAKYYAELFEGMEYSNEQIAQMFDKCFEDVQTGDLVVESDITIFSHCEHHLALMYDMRVAVGYIPNGRVIGLSKIARIADMCAKRLQLQERIGMDIADVLKKVLNTEDVIVVIEGKHACMTARGIRNSTARTQTSACHGKFRDEMSLRQEFYNLIK